MTADTYLERLEGCAIKCVAAFDTWRDKGCSINESYLTLRSEMEQLSKLLGIHCEDRGEVRVFRKPSV